jgi:phage tail sheath gpL-like
MTILFNSIPTTLRTPGPYIEIDNARAAAETVSMPEIALLIGMRLAAGTVAENVPTEVASVEAGEEYFGHGSMLAHMIEGFKNANPHTELWAIAVDEDGGGTAATGTIVFSGTSTAAGNVYLYIGGERIVTAIPSGTAAAAVGPLVVTAVTAHMTTSNMPVVASGPAATTTFTALHKTTLGDDLDIRLNYNANEALPAGITAVVTNIGDVVAGAGTDTISAVITAMADDWYTTIANCFYDDTNMDLMEAELTTRWGPTSMRDGVCFISAPGNQAALTALGNARNSQFTCYMGAGLSPTPTWYWAAVTAAVDAGESDAARPRQTLQLPGCLAPAKGSQFTQTERGVLLTDGIATYTVGVADGLVRVERLITTYQSNSLSVPDTSYLDVTTMRTLAYLRWSWAARITTKFPRHKLADDGTNFAPGQAVVTPAILRAEALGIFRDDWEPAGLVEGWEQFKEDLRVERSATDDNRIDMVMSPDLMNQFRVFAGQMQFLL